MCAPNLSLTPKKFLYGVLTQATAEEYLYPWYLKVRLSQEHKNFLAANLGVFV